MDVVAMAKKLNEDKEFCRLRSAVTGALSHKYGSNPMHADAVAICVRAGLEGRSWLWWLIAQLAEDVGAVTDLAFYVQSSAPLTTVPADLTADEVGECDCEGECHTCMEAIARRWAGV